MRVLCEHKDPALRKKIKADAAKNRGREDRDPCPSDLSYLLARKADRDCDLLKWFLEGKSLNKYLLTTDFVPDLLGLV